jgi:hypothetical protein
VQNTYPILEFDPAPEAIIEPSRLIKPMDVPEHCVICFFREVIAQVVREREATVIASHRWEDATHPIYEIDMNGKRLAFVHPGVPYLVGKMWRTDAAYRETAGKVALRKSEGCLTVEMEAASFFAVAQFRRVTFAQILCGGDDVSGTSGTRAAGTHARRRAPQPVLAGGRGMPEVVGGKYDQTQMDPR